MNLNNCLPGDLAVINKVKVNETPEAENRLPPAQATRYVGDAHRHSHLT